MERTRRAPRRRHADLRERMPAAHRAPAHGAQELSEKLFTDENNARLLGAKNHYGTGTRSYNRSAEKKEMDRQRAKATQAHLGAGRSQAIHHHTHLHLPQLQT